MRSKRPYGGGSGPGIGSGSPVFRRRSPYFRRAVLADDQVLVRAGFRALLDAQDDIEVVGEAGDGEQAVRLATELTPDVVLMDIRMPGTDGLAATRRISADGHLAGVRVVILTTFELDEYVFEAIRSGAGGFLVKDTEPDELAQAVRVVAGGDALLSPSVTRRLIGEFAARAKAPHDTGALTS
jgi:DNA-binding NarL/FixJ family response regulator